MAEKTVKTRIQVKRGTSAEWALATNFVPKEGEIIFYSDLNQIKIGKKGADGNGMLLKDLPFLAVNLIEVTYQELKNLRDTGNLIPGVSYRITDYQCTTTQENTQSANHQFDIIVTADDEKTLNENARAIQHAGDIYFINCDLAAWELKYNLTDEHGRFLWTLDNSNSKGTIYYMKDEFNNEAPYDFKNIQFIRKINTDPFGKCYLDLENGTDTWCYTFGGKYDRSVSQPFNINIFRDNVISIYINDQNWSELPNNVFIGQDIVLSSMNNQDIAYDNILDFGCHNNTFDTNCRSNRLKMNCYNNTFGEYCYSNTFGSYCTNNKLGQDSYNTSFGDECSGNIFISSCSYVTFGDCCRNNHFEHGCCYNTFGNECNSNTFDGYCTSNTFSNECNSNTFGGDCCYNTFDKVSSNTLDYGCSFRKIINGRVRVYEAPIEDEDVVRKCDLATLSSSYTAGEGISISEDGVISISFLHAEDQTF